MGTDVWHVLPPMFGTFATGSSLGSPTPAALAGLLVVTSSAPMFGMFATDIWHVRHRLFLGFVNPGTAVVYNLKLVRHAQFATVASTEGSHLIIGGVCRRGSPTSAIQTGIEDLEVGVRGNGRDAPGILVSEAGRQ